MIGNLIILGLGMVLGAMGMMVFIVLVFDHYHKPKKPPTKDEWRMM